MERAKIKSRSLKGGCFMKYLGNAFSLQMLSLEGEQVVKIKNLNKENFIEELKDGFISAIGHADTSQVLTDELGLEIETNRISINLKKGDVLLVTQLVGGRLPEGATTLPEGFAFKYLKVELV